MIRRPRTAWRRRTLEKPENWHSNTWEEPMLQMNYWTDKWDLDETVCPCDVHFNDWVAEEKLKNKTIFHFGTGTHHVVGIKQAQRKNRVVGITASKEEYEAYV